MSSPDREFWQSQRVFIEYMTLEAVGFRVSVYWVSSRLSGVGKADSYQIMPAQPVIDRSPKLAEFWRWHLAANQQEFSTPIEAAARFVEAWREWRFAQAVREEAGFCKQGPGGCGHTEQEHAAFDAGAEAGGRGEDQQACPYQEVGLREAWQIGHSAGEHNRREVEAIRREAEAI